MRQFLSLGWRDVVTVTHKELVHNTFSITWNELTLFLALYLTIVSLKGEKWHFVNMHFQLDNNPEPTVIKLKLLLSSDEQLCVVQYGEIDR